MHDARLEASGGKGALGDAVIASGAFDGNDAIAELVCGKSLPDLCDGGVEAGTVVRNVGGWNEDTAVEVSEEELGAKLGAIEADDAEMFGTDLLDAWMQYATRLADVVDRSAWRRATARARVGHEKSLP
jgi:hypothetical protein